MVWRNAGILCAQERNEMWAWASASKIEKRAACKQTTNSKDVPKHPKERRRQQLVERKRKKRQEKTPKKYCVPSADSLIGHQLLIFLCSKPFVLFVTFVMSGQSSMLSLCISLSLPCLFLCLHNPFSYSHAVITIWLRIFQTRFGSVLLRSVQNMFSMHCWLSLFR